MDSPNKCVTCISGTYLKDNVCYKECPAGYYGDIDTCKACDSEEPNNC